MTTASKRLRQIKIDCHEWPEDQPQHRLRNELRIKALEEALRDVVRQVNDYEQANQLSPNPGHTECWDSVARAKALLK